MLSTLEVLDLAIRTEIWAESFVNSKGPEIRLAIPSQYCDPSMPTGYGCNDSPSGSTCCTKTCDCAKRRNATGSIHNHQRLIVPSCCPYSSRILVLGLLVDRKGDRPDEGDACKGSQGAWTGESFVSLAN